MKVRVGVIGCGLVGQRRARAAGANPRSELVAVADVDQERAVTLGRELGAAVSSDWQHLIARGDLDAVAVCTFNKYLSEISVAALNRGIHVLCEKPPGRNTREAAAMIAAATESAKVLKIGFNLRFHPAVTRLHALCESGDIGRPFYLRATYGHGGRPGYENEWRADPELSGGGELLDQGVHLLDLATWLMGDLEVVAALTSRWFWPVAPLEDNAFALLRSTAGQVVSLHTSWTQWRNRFELEVTGHDGYARVSGLGGSYGVETLSVGHRRDEGGQPSEQSEVFTEHDTSWELDWDDFVGSCVGDHAPAAGGDQAVRVMRLVDSIYDSAVR